VIVAGRYLAVRPELKTGLPVKSLALSTFDYEIIREFVAKQLAGFHPSTVAQLAAHIMYLTGGHPGCIDEAVRLFKTHGGSPDDFFDNFAQRIWTTWVAPAARSMLDEMPDQEADFLDTLAILAVFRQLDHIVLRHIIADFDIQGFSDEYDLAGRLTATYIYTFKDRLFRDDMIRRLFSLRQWLPGLWADEADETYAGRCQTALAICKKRFQEKSIERSEKWTIEYMYQSLQQYAPKVQDPEKRCQIRRHFFEEALPQALDIFIIDRDIQTNDLEAEKHALLQALDEDWEFQFTINYYTREDQYNNKPYQRVKTEIDGYFSKRISGGNDG
jgi:hypothetical protein